MNGVTNNSPSSFLPLCYLSSNHCLLPSSLSLPPSLLHVVVLLSGPVTLGHSPPGYG